MTRTTRRAVLAGGLKAAAWLGGAAVLGGCAVQSEALRGARPPDLPDEVELDTTPFFPQTAYQCGPAALATALGAVGIAASPEQLADRIFLPARQGSLQIEVIAGARRAGAVATVLPGTLLALLQELAAGRVVLVLQNLGLDMAPVWHYAVPIGYSLARQEMVLRSGTERRLVMRLSTFEHTWVRAGSWAIAVLPPGHWPRTAPPRAVVDAAIGFERTAPPALALRAYASATQRWPGELALAMGLGNTAYAAGQRVLAAEAFASAARRHRSAAAWINLGRILLDAGLPDSAWRAALEAEYLADPAWRTETTALLREVYPLRTARAAPDRVATLTAAPSAAAAPSPAGAPAARQPRRRRRARQAKPSSARR
jgi:hypothetical protein